MKKFHVRQGPFNFAGLFFSLIGFILVLLCLVGCQGPNSRGLYFAKVSNAIPATHGSAIAVYYGWQGYCVEQDELTCFSDRSVMVVPFGKKSFFFFSVRKDSHSYTFFFFIRCFNFNTIKCKLPLFIHRSCHSR